MEIDASDYMSVGIILLYNVDAIVYPIAFFFKKHSLAECNHEIYDI